MGCGGEEEGGRRGLTLRSTERRQVALTAKTFTLSLRRAYEIEGTLSRCIPPQQYHIHLPSALEILITITVSTTWRTD